MGRAVLVAGWCALLALLAGCATTGGVQVAGPAAQVKPPPTSTPLPKGTPPSEDAIAVLRADPKLNAKIKSTLVPCDDGHYPIDDRYTDVTGDGVADLIVTLLPCLLLSKQSAAIAARSLPGYAAYIYNIKTHPAVRIFSAEGGGVEVVTESDRMFAVVHDRYLVSDDPCCPTDQSFQLYRWNGTKFVETKK
jgi:hypothetical protein